MVEVVEESRIARPADAVWATLADFDGIARWAPNVDHSSLTTAQADGVGAIRRVQVGRNALLERIIGWEPGRQLAYEIAGLPRVVRSVTNTWEITPTGDGASLSLTTRIDAGPRPPQQLVARLVGRAMAKASRQMLAGLRHHVESSPP